MISVIRCTKAEFLKSKRSILLYIHFMIPVFGAMIFAGYFHISSWNVVTKVSAYLEVLAVSFPFLVGIVVGMIVQIENQAGHFQLMLGTIPSRTATYLGKLVFLVIGAISAVVLALGVFCIIYWEAPLWICLKAGSLLMMCAIPLYLIHLFVGMSFGKGASMGLGIAGSLISALMITGLGDDIWKYVPWAWGVRLADYTVLAWDKPDIFRVVQSDFMIGIWIVLLCSLCLLFASLVWFRSWEGGNNYE